MVWLIQQQKLCRNCTTNYPVPSAACRLRESLVEAAHKPSRTREPLPERLLGHPITGNSFQ